MKLAIMLEGQDGLNWTRWQRLAQAAETLGYAGLYRSDHYTNARPPDKDSLELWVSLTWLAGHTQRLEFGPLVSPVSFRHPTMTARMAAAVDDLSGGRLRLGLGAGWQQREHQNYSWDLLDVPQRFKRFEEGLDIITQLLSSDEPVDYQGEYYQLNEAVLLPRPQQPGGPPIIIGGNGPKRTLPLAARYADEWNSVYLSPQKFANLNAQLDELLQAWGRSPAQVRRSLMANVVFGRNEADLSRKLQGRSADDLRAENRIVGTPAQVVDQLGRLAEAGVQCLMMQWLDQDDIDGLEGLAQTVLPQFQ